MPRLRKTTRSLSYSCPNSFLLAGKPSTRARQLGSRDVAKYARDQARQTTMPPDSQPRGPSVFDGNAS
jgi:hypothetical protein